MIIDVHSHLAWHKIFPSRFMQEVADSINAESEEQRAVIHHIIRAGLSDAAGNKFIRKMDEAGIDKAVLLIADFGIALGEPDIRLEDMFLLHKEVRDMHPERFMVFGGVDPARGITGVELFEKSITEYGFNGLKLYPPCGFELDDQRLYPLYEICNSLSLPVLTHTGPSLSSLRTEKRYPETILAVSEKFKKINFILAHAGARDCETTLEVVAKRNNVFFDISTYQRFMTQDELRFWMNKFCNKCPDRILFGTDWPMFLLSATQKQLVQNIKMLDGLTSGDLERIFFKNASYVLSI